MELKIRYENGFQTLSLGEADTIQLAKCLCVEIDGLDADEIEIVVQDAFDDEFNDPEYKNWRKNYRHRGYTAAKEDEDGHSVDPNVPLMKEMVEPWTLNYMDESIERDFNREKLIEKLRDVLKPDAADMVISIQVDGWSVEEYAELIGDTPNNVSHRYRRALRNLKKYFQK